MVALPGGAAMPTRRRQPIEIAVDPRLWRRLQQEAALLGLTPDDWLEQAIVAKNEDAVDIREAKRALAEETEWITLEQLEEELRGAERPPKRRRAV